MAACTYVARHAMRIHGLDDHSNSDEGSPFAQTVFDRNPGRGPLEKTLCAEVAPCQLATDVIGPLQYVGVALGLCTARGGQSKRKLPFPHRNRSLSTFAK
jgi:hypothetical protein